ncbi:cyanidin 3-O-galactoside 2''-O-xylosyltransferase FGGT1-like [Humulus lupulus]|uniref:cyanidin 3-O-galactoside 2''-O-xylosyltransferase FGGT1-like n=1 Tax=Humulus lupulus TaxID=3486 RepID=UPI002B406E99|nr:cyanidin 3-O-galactoside 2''-O-xylosyltransferase FGGT1-like [Humulus lupulus]
MESPSSLHIAMYPWFAFGHITPFLYLSNKLAQKGHRISFLIPTKTQSKMDHLNRFPALITFVPITVPHVEGLPIGAETTHGVPHSLVPLIMTAMDRTEPDVELLLRELKPDFVFFDFVHWIPKLARSLGIKSLEYSSGSPMTVAYNFSPARQAQLNGVVGREVSEADIMQPPPGFPDPSIKLHLHEARAWLKYRTLKFGSDILFRHRLLTGLSECEALGFKACKEIEGPFIDYLETQFGKPMLLSGPLLPDPGTSSMARLDEKWLNWLGGFEPGSVVYCCIGSEITLSKDQFQELLLGLELSGLPFLAALRPPSEVAESLSIEEALPEGFLERVGGRGVVYGGWIQQPQILEHPSVGCFVTHCGWGSLMEAMVNKCELVLLPNGGDQIYNARLMGNHLKVGVEVEKDEEDGLFTRESVSKAIRIVAEEDSEVGREVKANRAKLRELLLREDMESSYLDDFIRKLKSLLD